MEGTKYTVVAKMYTHSCCNCGVLFAIPDDLDARLRINRERFYCPHGHGQSYTKSKLEMERDLLAKQLEREAKRRQAWEREATLEAQRRRAAERRTAAAKGQVTKIKKRVGNGVCPCCNRTFSQLAKHMASKHPEYARQEQES
jgi:hypothetical protein